MIIVRSPYRISLLGGGSDYPNYIAKHGSGYSIGFTIDKYSYVAAKILPSFFPYKSKFTYSETETVDHNILVKHQAIWHTIQECGVMDLPLEVNHFSDIPSNSALGSSSAFLLSLVAALNLLKTRCYLDKETLLRLAVKIERQYSTVGWQDAALSSMGGFNFFEFTENGIQRRMSYSCGLEPMQKYGLLFYLNEPRTSSAIVNTYYKHLTEDPCQKEIANLAVKGEQILRRSYHHGFDFEQFCELIKKSWQLKRSLSHNIMTKKVYTIQDGLIDYYKAFRLLGSGGGGSIFFLAEPETHNFIKSYCEELGCIHIPYKIDYSGTKVIQE